MPLGYYEQHLVKTTSAARSHAFRFEAPERAGPFAREADRHPTRIQAPAPRVLPAVAAVAVDA